MGKPIAPAKSIAFAFPDVCQTPTPAGPVPIPYPNVAMLADASPVSNTGNPLLVGPAGDPVVLKDSVVAASTGDEPGSASPTKGPCRITQASASVVYGSNSSGVVRFMDTTSQNNGNATGFVLSAFPTVLVGD